MTQSQTPFFRSIILGNITKSVTVGKKHVLTILAPDYYLSKKTGKSEVDSYQVNLFENDFNRLLTENPTFQDVIDRLKNGVSSTNMEVDIKITMSKEYTNAKGIKVYPHPEFKLLDVRSHEAATNLASSLKAQTTSLEEGLSEEMPF